jgi:hypothetical protein
MAEGPARGLPPAGWYKDPAGSDAKRWWDGQAWGALEEPSRIDAGGEQPPIDQHRPKVIEQAPPRSSPVGPRGFAYLAERNGSALTTVAIAVLYVVLAATFHIHFFGILPIFTALASYRRREFLWPLAAALAVGTLVLSLSGLQG